MTIWSDAMTEYMAAAVREMNGRWRKAGCPVPSSSLDADERDRAEYIEEMSLGGQTYDPYCGPHSGARGGHNR